MKLTPHQRRGWAVVIVMLAFGAFGFYLLLTRPTCAERKCDRGQPVLVQGRCFCMEPAK